MDALHMLDVAIGLIFVFLLVSLICTALSELAEKYLKYRAADLARGIRQLLNDKDGNGLTALVYKHPLISSLFRDEYTGPKTKRLPSYIPSRNFALALYDIIRNPDMAATPPGIDEQDWAQQKHKLKQIVDALGITLVGNADKNIKGIEDWFNGTMDRVSGWYKRRVQGILIVLGLIVATIMNVDTIAVFKSLNDDPVQRSALVAAAQEFAKSNTPGDTTDARKRVEENSEKLRELRLPIGWDWDKPSDEELRSDPKYVTNYFLAYPKNSMGWTMKIIGLLITSLAVSLGASFWFDALNKIMVIRSTVKPKEKSQDEGSADR